MTSGARAGDPSKRLSLREVALRLILLLVSLTLGLLLAEVGVRWLRPQRGWIWTPPGPFVVQGPGDYELLPGYRGICSNRIEYTTHVSINRAGLRGPEIGPKPAGVCRILIIGDSFTFGIGVEDHETFPALLGEILSGDECPPGVLNGGVSAMGVPHEVRWLERHGLAVEPDVVILATFLGNDLQDAMTSWSHREVVDGRLTQKQERSALKEWLFLHSQLFVLLKHSVPTPVQQWIRAHLGLEEPWSLRRARSSFSFFAKELSEATREGVSNTEMALDRLVEIAELHDLKLAALTIPDIMQVDPERWAANLRQLGVDPSDVDPDVPTEIMLDLLAERRIPALDLTVAFREAVARGEPLYYPIDRHWTPLGHRRAAALLADFVRRLDFRCQKERW